MRGKLLPNSLQKYVRDLIEIGIDAKMIGNVKPRTISWRRMLMKGKVSKFKKPRIKTT